MRSHFVWLKTSSLDSDLVSIFLECETLSAFLKQSNEAGLSLPTDFDVAMGQMERIRWACMMAFLVGRPACPDLTLLNWPPRELLSCLSLAQHYGIPTRLLDFSGSALHAAFFAANGLDDARPSGDPSFAVVCINPSKLPHPTPLDEAIGRTLFWRTPARHGNPNIVAPRGMFLYQSIPYAEDHAGKFVDYCVRQPLEEVRVFAPATKIGVRISCPSSERDEVLHLLKLQGVTKSTVFPGYDSVASDVKESLGLQ